ncbi:MAG: hypothetical protein SNJ76_05425 [Fimbriimonadaceae bacterium]
MTLRRTLLLASACLSLTACRTPDVAANGTQTAGRAGPAEITIDGTKTFQTVDGFGTCLISWDANMAAWYRRPEAVRIYAEELRFNILRTNLWGDGTIGPVADPARISHRDPAFARDDPRTPVFLEFARAARRINPDFKVIGSVWSPPAWMKENGRITDTLSGAIMGDDYTLNDNKGVSRNRVIPSRYPHMARWIVEMVRHYEANGVPVYAVSPANEPQFTQTFESCLWTPRDLAAVAGMTARELRAAGLGRVKLFGPETMTGFNWENGPNFRYTAAWRANADAFGALGFWATHGYADGVRGDTSSNSLAQFWEIVKGDDKPFWVTEGGTGGHTWPEPVKEGGVGLALHHAFVAGNASAFVPWQYAEDATTEHNLMPLSGPNKKTHVVRHYSRFIPAGSVRIGAEPGYGAVHASAFRRGRDLTVVLLNAGDRPQTVALRLRGIERVERLNAVRTSANEDSKALAPIAVSDGTARVEVPGPGIVTLTTLPL